MSKKKIIIDAPKNPIVRYKFVDERHVDLDMRGIRNLHSPFQGGVNPSKGSQRKFLSPEHLDCMVNEYFESCNGPMFDRNGELVKDPQGNIVKVQVKPYTLSGLALYLGVSTQTLKHYREGRLDTILDEMKAETDDRLTFSRVVLRAKQTIEAYAEGRLYDKDGQRGAQFVLDCCYNWVDHRTASDIKRSKAERQMKREELDLKKKMLDEADEDGTLTVNIVRGSRDEE